MHKRALIYFYQTVQGKEGKKLYPAQLDGIRHPDDNELRSNELMQASTMQLPHDCPTGIGKDRLDTIFLMPLNPILQQSDG